MPMTAFIGVRISWLMVARKMLFDAFASSAAVACLLRLCVEPGIVERDRGELPEALQELDLFGCERAAVGRVACDAERADGLGSRAKRHGCEPADDARVDGRIPGGPGVVVVHDERGGGRPYLAGRADAAAEASTPVGREEADGDVRLDLVCVGCLEIDVSVGRSQHLAGALDDLGEELLEIETLHDPDRRLVECLELDVLFREFVGALCHALLEAFERLA